tara:strand:- start:530 stop:1300 length:771 start_codon:yes stop_codon:yes gene_type:complete
MPKWKPGLNRTTPIEDLPEYTVEPAPFQGLPEYALDPEPAPEPEPEPEPEPISVSVPVSDGVEEDEEEIFYPSVQSLFSSRYSWEPDQDETFNNFIENTKMIESEGGTVNTLGSNARGPFQAMVQEKKPTSFHAGLVRLRRLLENWGVPEPPWVEEAFKHGDPEKLTYEQNEDWFLANMWSQIKDPEETEKTFTGAASGDLDYQMKLYKLHHSMGGSKKNRENAWKRARKIYNGTYGDEEYKGGGLIRDIYGRTLI